MTRRRRATARLRALDSDGDMDPADSATGIGGIFASVGDMFGDNDAAGDMADDGMDETDGGVRQGAEEKSRGAQIRGLEKESRHKRKEQLKVQTGDNSNAAVREAIVEQRRKLNEVLVAQKAWGWEQLEAQRTQAIEAISEGVLASLCLLSPACGLPEDSVGLLPEAMVGRVLDDAHSRTGSR